MQLSQFFNDFGVRSVRTDAPRTGRCPLWQERCRRLGNWRWERLDLHGLEPAHPTFVLSIDNFDWRRSTWKAATEQHPDSLESPSETDELVGLLDQMLAVAIRPANSGTSGWRKICADDPTTT